MGFGAVSSNKIYQLFLPNNVSVFTAELCVIGLAIKTIGICNFYWLEVL